MAQENAKQVGATLKLIITATLTLTLCLGVGPGIGSTLNVGWDFVVIEPKQRLL